MPRKIHARTRHKIDREDAGFISDDITRTMNKNEKIIMGILVGGILVFLALSILVLFGKGKENTSSTIPTSTVGPTTKVNLTPYPTIPPVEDTTVMINSRRFNPQVVTIPRGGFVAFLNIDSDPITIEANDQNSSILNIGTIAPGDQKQVTFKDPGTYTFRNKAKPTMTGIITIN